MLNLSIRRKLFLAFALVAAISSAALLLLARSYLGSVRAELDRHFLEAAHTELERQSQRTAGAEDEALDSVANSALDPDAMESFLGDRTLWQTFFDRSPAIEQLAVFDTRTGVIVHAWMRPGATITPIGEGDAEALMAQREIEISSGPVPRFAVLKDGRYFAIANSGTADAPRKSVVAELDLAYLFGRGGFGDHGQVLQLDFKHDELWHLADAAARSGQSLAGLERVLAQRPEHGALADVDNGHGRRYRVYTAVSAEEPSLALRAGVEAVALMPLDELYAPLQPIRQRVILSVAATVLLALCAALLLSGRFVADIERIRGAVAAFARGDWRRLEKSSRDELGGALVDSINDMATAVAERMRREEAESWRSLVRVVSHEINNTLAPIRSVADTLRSGMQRRLRDDDPGADVDMALKLIVERVDALATFIDGYAEVAKLPAPVRSLTDVTRLVAGAAALFAEEAERRGVTLDVSAEPGAAAALDAQQMERVLVNLIKNAIEAAPEGSAVAVRATLVAGSVELTVADDGPGIAAEARRNLFVPYFTTKPGGSGIGLALARQIVVAHGGTITAERSPSGGTLMRVVVPAPAHGHPYREAG